jgi:pimeloyl-ACP methyl ester carboxylesterase/DNA-binding CsgD family transcriptional regulator
VDQRIAETALHDGTRIAFAVCGRGPFLVCAPGWVSHLELGWATPSERGFYEALARDRTVIRYDLPGCGLSGALRGEYSLDVTQATLGAVVEAAGADRFELFGASLGAAVAAQWAAEHPDTVSKLMLYGAWVRGADIASPEIQTHVLGLVAEHWGLGSDVLADIFAPDAGATAQASFARYQRESAPATTARDLLALSYGIDASAALASLHVPTLVLHRDRDRAVPVAQGHAVAALVPGAQFVSLPGRSHLPSVGDVDALTRAVRRFLGLTALRTPVVPTLTPRQVEVAALIAGGATNREIAARLTITERSVESHLERICARMGFRSRSQIAAWYAAGGRGRIAAGREEASA